MKGVISVEQIYSILKWLLYAIVAFTLLFMAAKALFGGSGPDILASVVKTITALG